MAKDHDRTDSLGIMQSGFADTSTISLLDTLWGKICFYFCSRAEELPVHLKHCCPCCFFVFFLVMAPWQPHMMEMGKVMQAADEEALKRQRHLPDRSHQLGLCVCPHTSLPLPAELTSGARRPFFYCHRWWREVMNAAHIFFVAWHWNQLRCTDHAAILGTFSIQITPREAPLFLFVSFCLLPILLYKDAQKANSVAEQLMKCRIHFIKLRWNKVIRGR